jgi:hypothetical protein
MLLMMMPHPDAGDVFVAAGIAVAGIASLTSVTLFMLIVWAWALGKIRDRIDGGDR